MAELLKEMNITSVAFNRLWNNLNTRILPNKVDVEEGKGLSTNDFTNELLAKLNGIEENANKYVHPTSGVSAGTYRSVTVDEKGHITAGTNPDTLAGYGVTAVPADLLTGTISIDRLPHAALERCVVVANDEARFALTTENAQIGDTVKVQDTNKMYFIVDDAQLGTEAGYEEYKVGTAAAVDWSGVLNKPETFTPAEHTHTISEITDFPTALKNPNAVTIKGGNFTIAPDGTITNEDVVYDGENAASIDIAASVANIMKAIANGKYAADQGIVMTAADVDAMMGLNTEP